MKYRVVKNMGSSVWVQSEDGSQREVHVKGKFRIQGIRTTSPVAVGDWVTVEGDLIAGIEPRDNYIIRRSSNLSKHAHILAANVDLALLVVTLTQPETALEFIDRFLMTAEAYHVPTVLLVNKVDLLGDAQRAQCDAFCRLYGGIGYRTMELSVLQGRGVDEVRSLLAGKVCLLAGNSGVGKSSLLNALDPQLSAKVGRISEAHLTGMHTTTFSEMYPVAGGYVIDTPGVKGFGIVDMEPAEIAQCFPEMRRLSVQCRFQNCSHTHEPGCRVLDALEQGEIAASRYDSYCSILEDVSAGKYR